MPPLVDRLALVDGDQGIEIHDELKPCCTSRREGKTLMF
jgi:hypothetical protein